MNWFRLYLLWFRTSIVVLESWRVDRDHQVQKVPRVTLVKLELWYLMAQNCCRRYKRLSPDNYRVTGALLATPVHQGQRVLPVSPAHQDQRATREIGGSGGSGERICSSKTSAIPLSRRSTE